MDREELQRLNELREELEVSKEDYQELLVLAFQYIDEKHLNEETIYEIVEEALNNIDYDNIIKSEFRTKTIKEAFKKALIDLGYEKSGKFDR